MFQDDPWSVLKVGLTMSRGNVIVGAVTVTIRHHLFHVPPVLDYARPPQMYRVKHQAKYVIPRSEED